MFTWICPQCGHEVPPHLNDCPNCVAKTQPVPPAPPAPPSQPVYAAPPPVSPPPPPPPQPVVAAPPPPPAPAPVPGYVIGEPRRSPAHGLMVALLVAAVVVGVGWLAYKLLLPSSRAPQPAAAAAETTKFEVPQTGLTKAHPLGKYIEITGLRVTEDARQRLQVKLAVVNHSAAEIGDLKMNVRLKPVTSKPDTPVVAEFPLEVKSLGAFQVVDLTVSAKTSLRAYEFPDWQFLRAEFEITAP